ncbi:hypothetical protein BH09PLA1_BH09PLA1_14090 [soil metagenome]
MPYWSDLFNPETYEAFGRSDRTISGFRESQRTMAEKVRVADKLVCYMVRMSRWVKADKGPSLDSSIHIGVADRAFAEGEFVSTPQHSFRQNGALFRPTALLSEQRRSL